MQNSPSAGSGVRVTRRSGAPAAVTLSVLATSLLLYNYFMDIIYSKFLFFGQFYFFVEVRYNF